MNEGIYRMIILLIFDSLSHAPCRKTTQVQQHFISAFQANISPIYINFQLPNMIGWQISIPYNQDVANQEPALQESIMSGHCTTSQLISMSRPANPAEPCGSWSASPIHPSSPFWRCWSSESRHIPGRIPIQEERPRWGGAQTFQGDANLKEQAEVLRTQRPAWRAEFAFNCCTCRSERKHVDVLVGIRL